MTGTGRKPARAPDWAAIRRDYQTSPDPIWKVAARHGVTQSRIDHRRRSEGWQSRGDLAKLKREAQGLPSAKGADWGKIRAEYENGEFSIWDICERHGIAQTSFYRRKRRESWAARRDSFPNAYGAGGTVKAAERLKALVARELSAIEARLGLGEKLDARDPLRALHTLASAVQKILDIEHREKTADAGDRNRLVIDERSRLALAQRLETLARHWEASGNSGGTHS